MNKRIKYLIICLFTLILGLSLVFFFSQIPNLRGYFGDFLVVIFLFSGFKTIFKNFNAFILTVLIFCFSVTIEILQYFNISDYFNKENLFIQIIIGSTFDLLDILMYFTGCILIFFVDKLLLSYSETIT